MNKKKFTKVMSILMSTAFATTAMAGFAGCFGGGSKKDSLVIMTEELNGLFNPFYATTGTDQDVVSMTQIAMLTTDHDGNITCGKDQATAVLDYDIKTENGNSVYYFVIKNDVKFSDGVPMTMGDVLFNMYNYLDPVYTGSSTMYSTKIVGLDQYRTQQNVSGGGSAAEQDLTNRANTAAYSRMQELIQLYRSTNRALGNSDTSVSVSEAQMKDAIASYKSFTKGYKDAIASASEQSSIDWNAQLLADYNNTLKSFKEELETDYASAKEAFDITTAPYAGHDEFKDEAFCFLYYEGMVQVEYELNPATNKPDKSKIKKLSYNKNMNTKEKAIDYVFSSTVESHFDQILQYWGTANTLSTEYAAKAKQVMLRNQVGSGLIYKNIEGIVSLGHEVEKGAKGVYSKDSVAVNGKEYKLATSHNSDGTPTSGDAYDVLRITVENTDPKAIYNFSFSVAPEHYYANDAKGEKVDIVNDKFGVEWGSFDFQKDVIQSDEHRKVPVGAGPYKATNTNNDDNPSGNDFFIRNTVYFKSNDNFMFDVQTKKVKYQVVSASDAIDNLKSGAVDFVTPQFTKQNAITLDGMKSKGFRSLDAWQLGYGYIGVNAGKIPDINLRRAIMCAMNTKLSLQFYETGMAEQIDWTMSKVNWAYPKEASGASKQNGHYYTQWIDEATAKKNILDLMNKAGVSAGDSKLKLKFTIAGSNMTEHPTYNTFKQAAEILNDCGWDIEVVPDTQALTKLATGSLAVWAAAWGSTIDPDMYQVYHKNSTATSVYSWGYREILNDTKTYSYEYGIVNKLSDVIDQARQINDQTQRKALYETAMGYVLDLAVEMPVYQRKTLYAYNANTIDESTMPSTVNPYSTPLERIWDVKLK